MLEGRGEALRPRTTSPPQKVFFILHPKQNQMNHYEKQLTEIKRLLSRIEKKCEGFNISTENPYFDDMKKVESDLSEIDNFMNNKYLDLV